MTSKSTTRSDVISRLLLLIGGAAVCLIVILSLRPDDGASETPKTEESATEEVGSGSGDSEAGAAFHRLEGRWLRPDGGYVLDLRWVGADGRVEAGYLNPQPIFVSRAEASQDGDRIRVMVELQDRGYPGCVYTLHYDAARDVLVGDYYQAAMRETFPVEFERTQ